MREPIPHIELELSDVADIRTLSKQELDKTPYEKKKWKCCIEGCNHYSSIRDYGIAPLFYWRRMWVDLSEQILYCAKHWKIFKLSGKDDSKFEYKVGAGLNHLV